MASKQKVYVDSLPEDCVQIKTYNGKGYTNLFYSPSTKKFYQAPEMKFRELNENARGCVRPMSNDGTTGSMYASVIEKRFHDQICEANK